MFGIFGSGPRDRQIRDDKLRSPLIPNPFPGRPATATADNPPTKLLGRDRERGELKSIFVKAASTDNSPLIIIQGETGMGKSALTSYVFNEIIRGEMDVHGIHAYSAFIEAYGEVRDFRLSSFYSQIMKSLDKYSLLEKIVARMIQFIARIVHSESDVFFKETFGDWDPDESISSTIQVMNDPARAQKMIDGVETALSVYLAKIRSRWRSIDTSFVRVLLLSQAAVKDRINALEALKSGSKFGSFSVHTDADAKHILNVLMDLLTAISPLSVMVIFIDQLEELFDNEQPKKIAMKVFTMLLTLRQIPKMSIVLSGNNQAYKYLMDNLYEDARDQIEQWHKYLHLPRLPAEDVTDIVYEMLNKFWSENDLVIDPKNPYYPLSERTIVYLYEKNDRNLRRTLINLHDIFNSFKDNEEVKDLSDPIKAIGDLQIISEPTILPRQIQSDFYEYLTSNSIQDKERSRIPEVGIYRLFEVLMRGHDFISELKESPKMPKSGKRPDIYYRLGGNLYHYDSRKVGIEVKCYRRGVQIDRGNVMKTVELLEKGDLDYVIWVSNVELHPETLASLSSEIKNRHVGIAPKTNEQMAYIYWAYIFDKAMGREPTLEEARILLDRIGIPSIFVSEPSELLKIEQERSAMQVKIETPIRTQIETKGQEKKGEIGDAREEKVTPIIGLDFHNKAQNFINDRIKELKGIGRKQIKKAKLYEDFMDANNLENTEKTEVEFLEILQAMDRKTDEFSTTKQLVRWKS